MQKRVVGKCGNRRKSKGRGSFKSIRSKSGRDYNNANCRCLVEYDNGSGIYKNSHTKRFYKDRQEETKKIDIERRKELDNKQNNNKRILGNARKSGITKDELKTDKQRQHMIASPVYKESKSYIW